MLSVNTRQAYTEIDNFIELLDEYNRNKVPKKLREFFKREKDNTYTKVIDPNIPIKEQKLKEETLALIAMLNLQYWCEDVEEKQRLKKIYSDNEIKHQQKLREMYNPEDVFKSKQKQEQIENEISSEKTQENVAMIEYKESIFEKIKRIITSVFRFYKK